MALFVPNPSQHSRKPNDVCDLLQSRRSRACAMMPAHCVACSASRTQGSPAIEANACPTRRRHTLAIELFQRSPRCLCATTAQADPIEDFYKGKTVTIVTSTGVGGPFDLTARALAQHMPKYLPGQPTMIVQATCRAAAMCWRPTTCTRRRRRTAPLIATVNNIIPLHQVLDGRGVRFDARKFNWLGSTGGSNLFTWVWHTAGFKTMDDVMRARADHRRDRRRLRHLHLSQRHEHDPRHQVQDRDGLRQQRRASISRWSAARCRRAAARASPACCRSTPTGSATRRSFALVQVGAERDKDYPDVPLMHELAQERRAAPGPGTDLLAALARPAVLHHAGRAARARRRAAQAPSTTP